MRLPIGRRVWTAGRMLERPSGGGTAGVVRWFARTRQAIHPFTRSLPSPDPASPCPFSLSLSLPFSLPPSPPRLASSGSLSLPFAGIAPSTSLLHLFLPRFLFLFSSHKTGVSRSLSHLLGVDRRGSSGCLSPFLSSGPRTGAGLTKLHRLFVIYLYFGSDRRQLVLV